MKLSKHTRIAFIAAVFCIVYGTTGIYLLRHQFNTTLSLFDSFYYTMVTYATLGSNDFTPSTELARMFITSMVFVGVGCFTTVITVVMAPFLENKIRKVLTMFGNIDHLNNHVIVCGLNPITLAIAKRYQKQGDEVLVITQDKQNTSELACIGLNYLLANPLHTTALEKAKLYPAKHIICALESDADTILLLMTVKQLLTKNPPKTPVKITAIIQDVIYESNARHCGAESVLLPAQLTMEALFSS